MRWSLFDINKNRFIFFIPKKNTIIVKNQFEDSQYYTEKKKHFQKELKDHKGLNAAFFGLSLLSSLGIFELRKFCRDFSPVIMWSENLSKFWFQKGPIGNCIEFRIAWCLWNFLTQSNVRFPLSVSKNIVLMCNGFIPIIKRSNKYCLYLSWKSW